MVNTLALLHLLTGLGGVLLPLWIAMEMLKREDTILKLQVRIAAAFTFLLIVISWVTGGIYYMDTYSSVIRPVIKSSEPWAHYIGMETKEHVFLFLPPLTLLLNILVWSGFEGKKRLIAYVCISIFALGILISTLGFIIKETRITLGVVI